MKTFNIFIIIAFVGLIVADQIKTHHMNVEHQQLVDYPYSVK